jgi:hypothetical protein
VLTAHAVDAAGNRTPAVGEETFSIVLRLAGPEIQILGVTPFEVTSRTVAASITVTPSIITPSILLNGVSQTPILTEGRYELLVSTERRHELAVSADDGVNPISHASIEHRFSRTPNRQLLIRTATPSPTLLPLQV